MDSHVRDLRDQFVTRAWSRQLYNGMDFSPERKFVENSVIFSQQNVTGQVNDGVQRQRETIPEPSNRCKQRSLTLTYLARFTCSAAQAMLAIFTTSRMPRWTHLKASVLPTQPG